MQGAQAVDARRAASFLAAVVPELFAQQAGPREVKALSAAGTSTPVGAANANQQLRQTQRQAEHAEIMRVLAACGGDRALASQQLGISRTTLWRKLKEGA